MTDRKSTAETSEIIVISFWKPAEGQQSQAASVVGVVCL